MSTHQNERGIEALTMGSLLLLFLVTLCSPLRFAGGGNFALLAAVILLGSAFYQKSQGWEVSGWTWLFGCIFAALYALHILASVLNFALGLFWEAALPLLLVGLVVWFIFFKDRE